MRSRETVGAPCFSRGKLDFSPAGKGFALEAALAAGGRHRLSHNPYLAPPNIRRKSDFFAGAATETAPSSVSISADGSGFAFRRQ